MQEGEQPSELPDNEPATPLDPVHNSVPAPPQPILPPHKEDPQPGMPHIKLFVGVGLAIIIGLAIWILWPRSEPKQQASTANKSTQTETKTAETTTSEAKTEISGLKLDTQKNYGNKYANGLLPVGDNKYVTDGAKKGSVYLCHANFVPAGQAGAQKRGPWFVNNNTQWDINKKTAIQGNINWTPQISNKITGNTRTISTNDLPDHHTGVFPVSKTDPARVYDANPNTIKSQTLIYNLSANPSSGSPKCMGGEVGVMLTGVALFNGFDAGGRDAGAWEVQDTCDGHPQNKGEYHYHTLSRCITNATVDQVIGFALDGFPITGPKIADGNILTTDDLDECHGIVSQVTLDDKKVTTYHYVMTQDFPYSASCFRASAIQPPGQPEH